MKNIVNKISILILLCLVTWNVSAQDLPQIRAKVDTTTILLGDQIHLRYEVEQKEGQSLEFPAFTDTIVSKMEVLGDAVIDTIQKEDKSFLRASYLITSFDSGEYKIPRFPVLLQQAEKKDTLLTPAVSLVVANMKLKSKDGIIDIQEPYKAPITLAEVTPWILGFLVVVSLILIILYGVYRYKNKKPFFSGPLEPEEPYEEKAERLLNALKEQIPEEKQQVKPFYVDLTDIIREYLSHRFLVSTLELTTDEIIDTLRNIEQTAEYKHELKDIEQVLRLADMVKFAKYLPDESDHPKQLNICLSFVEQTKPRREQEEASEEVESEEENVPQDLYKEDLSTDTEAPQIDEEEENLMKYGPKNNPE